MAIAGITIAAYSIPIIVYFSPPTTRAYSEYWIRMTRQGTHNWECKGKDRQVSRRRVRKLPPGFLSDEYLAAFDESRIPPMRYRRMLGVRYFDEHLTSCWKRRKKEIKEEQFCFFKQRSLGKWVLWASGLIRWARQRASSAEQMFKSALSSAFSRTCGSKPAVYLIKKYHRSKHVAWWTNQLSNLRANQMLWEADEHNLV